MTPQEIGDALGVTKQGAIKLIQPLPDAGLVQRIGTRKQGVTFSAKEGNVEPQRINNLCLINSL